jgi:D-xylose transport system substrate-binding protein
MNKLILAAAVAAVSITSSAVFAGGKSIGVSWASFQEERWKIDEAAMLLLLKRQVIHMCLQMRNLLQLSNSQTLKR